MSDAPVSTAPAAASTSPSFIGHCSCVAVTYHLTRPQPFRSYLCHCTDCRISSGSSFAHNAVFDNSDLVISDPEGCLTTFGSEADGSRRFCGRCGTQMFLTVPQRIESMKGLVIVCVGTVEGSQESEVLKPTHEGWCKRREKWLAKAEGTTEFEEW